MQSNYESIPRDDWRELVINPVRRNLVQQGLDKLVTPKYVKNATRNRAIDVKRQRRETVSLSTILSIVDEKGWRRAKQLSSPRSW